MIHIKINNKCVAANPKFTKEEQRLVISAMLGRINLPTFRSINLNLSIPQLGKIKTHGNKKKLNKNKYVKKYNKKKWKSDKLKESLTDKKLLF